jgi:hypothetical protein
MSILGDYHISRGGVVTARSIECSRAPADGASEAPIRRRGLSREFRQRSSVCGVARGMA